MAGSPPSSPTEILPSPGHTERRSAFLWRWMKSPRAKKVFHGKVAAEGVKVWEEAKSRSIVSVRTFEDEFLVFDDGR